MKIIDKQQKSIQFPDDLAREIEQLATEHERSFSAEVVYMLKQQIKQQKLGQELERWGESVNSEQL